MNGRICGIKKTYILRVTAVIVLLGFVCTTIYSLLKLKIPDLWFYNFCFAIGFFELTKGLLFKLDSSLYLGCLTTGIGIAGYIFWLTGTIGYAIFYIALAFITASIITSVKTKQHFHLVFAFSIFFVALYGILLKKSLINMSIFIAFVSVFLLLLIIEIIIFYIRRK